MKFGSLFATVCLAPPADLGSTTQPVLPATAESTLSDAATDHRQAGHSGASSSAILGDQGKHMPHPVARPHDDSFYGAVADQSKLDVTAQQHNAAADMMKQAGDKGDFGLINGNVGAIQL